MPNLCCTVKRGRVINSQLIPFAFQLVKEIERRTRARVRGGGRGKRVSEGERSFKGKPSAGGRPGSPQSRYKSPVGSRWCERG